MHRRIAINDELRHGQRIAINIAVIGKHIARGRRVLDNAKGTIINKNRRSVDETIAINCPAIIVDQGLTSCLACCRIFKTRCSKRHTRLHRLPRPADQRRIVIGDGEVSTIQHVYQIGDIRNIPSANVLIKCRSTTKHTARISQARCIPVTDVSIETIVQIEHECHTGDIGNVPCCTTIIAAADNGADVLIKCIRITEHIAHRGNVTGLPAGDVLIENGRACKHLSHGCDITHIPAADILIK